jgi:D-aspartate ligase
VGVPVFAVVENQFTPAARSRYLAGRFPWRTTGGEEPDDLVAQLTRIGQSIGKRAILVATDEEAAVLVAEQAARLRGQFVLPSVPPGIPRQLATKSALHSLCVEHGIPAPVSLRPRSPGEVLEFADHLGFPLVLKNDGPWLRLIRPAVASTAIIHDVGDLRRLVDSWATMPTVLMQEYIPQERSTDWIAHAYWGRDPDRQVIFTGRKLRSWPPQAGVTTYAYTQSNAEVAELTHELCSKVGFRGICDLDWRFDSAAGEYKLVDFNPRLGAQFRLFERTDGLDVIRAMHLDLTGRDFPRGHQIDGRVYMVENLDLPAQIAYWRAGEHEHVPIPRRHRELAWWAADDPLPALLGGVCSAAYAGRQLLTGKLGGHRPAALAKGAGGGDWADQGGGPPSP